MSNTFIDLLIGVPLGVLLLVGASILLEKFMKGEDNNDGMVRSVLYFVVFIGGSVLFLMLWSQL